MSPTAEAVMADVRHSLVANACVGTAIFGRTSHILGSQSLNTYWQRSRKLIRDAMLY